MDLNINYQETRNTGNQVKSQADQFGSLLGEIQAIPNLGEQAVDPENMTNLLLQEMEAYVLETARTTGTTDVASMKFSYEDGKKVLDNLSNSKCNILKLFFFSIGTILLKISSIK